MMRRGIHKLSILLAAGMICAGCGSAAPNGQTAASKAEQKEKASVSYAGKATEAQSVEETAAAEESASAEEAEVSASTAEAMTEEAAMIEASVVEDTAQAADREGRAAAEEDPYAKVLDFYYYSIQDSWAHYNEVEEDPTTGMGLVSFLFSSPYTVVRSLSDAGYARVDINGDGKQELIVSPMGVASMGLIYDLYDLEDGTLHHIAFSGERYAYTLSEGGALIFYGSNGAASTLNVYYELTENDGLSVKEEVNLDAMLDMENPWFYGSSEEVSQKVLLAFDNQQLKPISEEEATELMDAWPKAKELKLTSFEDYQPASEKPVYSLTQEPEEETDPYTLTQQEIEEIQAMNDHSDYRLKTEDLSQQEMNSITADVFRAWDEELNIIWKRLKGILSPEEMASLTQEERLWIQNKEQKMKEAGAEYEGGSMQSMIIGEEGARITRERVYELAERYMKP